tara:strand:+ start:255 stop:506 length:252 start_codon:yes stop_codon:yes gene_type:complete
MLTIIIFKDAHNNINWRFESQIIPSSIILGVIQVKFGDLEVIDFNSIKINYVNEFYATKRGLIILMENSNNFVFHYEKVKESK